MSVEGANTHARNKTSKAAGIMATAKVRFNCTNYEHQH